MVFMVFKVIAGGQRFVRELRQNTAERHFKLETERLGVRREKEKHLKKHFVGVLNMFPTEAVANSRSVDSLAEVRAGRQRAISRDVGAEEEKRK